MYYFSKYSLLYEDIEPGLIEQYERFYKLTFVGKFKEAKEYWKQNLDHLPRTFHKEIAMIDLEYRQNNYGAIEDRLRGLLAKDFSEDEPEFIDDHFTIFKLIKANSGIFTNGSLRFALKRTRELQLWLQGLEKSINLDLKHNAIEVYLRMMKQIGLYSSFAKIEDFIVPGFEQILSTENRWGSFYNWSQTLFAEKRFIQYSTTLALLGTVYKVEIIDSDFGDLLKELRKEKVCKTMKLVELTTLIAYSRFLSFHRLYPRAIAQVERARELYNQICGSDNSHLLPRQFVEIQIALVESEPNMAPEEVYKIYGRSADICKEHEIYGLEDFCLQEVARYAASKNDIKLLNQWQTRLEYIQENLERDRASKLITRIGLWRAGSNAHLGSMLDWFNNFDLEYPVPLEVFKESPPEPDEHHFDNPTLRFREFWTKSIILTAAGSASEANEPRMLAARLAEYVPSEEILKLGLNPKYKWLIEWKKGSLGQVKTCWEVLYDRLFQKFGVEDLDEAMERFFLRIMTGEDHLPNPQKRKEVLSLGWAQVAEIFLPFHGQHLTQDQFSRRMTALESWFSTDVSFCPGSSEALIANLYRERVFRSDSKGMVDFDSLERDQKAFINYSLGVQDTSVKEYLYRSILLAREFMFDVRIKLQLDITREKLIEIRDEFENLAEEYETSHLASEFSRIGTIYGRLAELAFRLDPTQAGLDGFQVHFDKANNYFDNLRGELSVLSGDLASNVMAGMIAVYAGSQDILDRATTLFTIKYFELEGIDKPFQTKIARMLWTVIQRNKGRVLNTLLSSSNQLPTALTTRMQESPAQSAWINQLKGISDLKNSVLRGESGATELDAARRRLLEMEESLKEDPKNTAILSFVKGNEVSIDAVTDTLKEVASEEIVLVDWFTANKPPLDKPEGVLNKLYMMTLKINDSADPICVFELESGIGVKAQQWVTKYLRGENQNEADLAQLEGLQAYRDLQALAGLVSPLRHISQPGDRIIFCPTTQWMLHQIPLHALITDPAPFGENEETVTDLRLASGQLMFARNLVSYTPSHSLLRLGVISRQQMQKHEKENTTVSSICPLSISDAKIGNKTVEKAQRQAVAFATLFNGLSLLGEGVSRSPTSHLLQDSELLMFLGHVFTDPSGDALEACLSLGVPETQTTLEDTQESPHEIESKISARSLMSTYSLKEGAHINLLSCQGGVAYASRSANETQGLIPAFLQAGARSVIGALWSVDTSETCDWAQYFMEEWDDEDQELDDKTEFIDLVKLMQGATLREVNKCGLEAVSLWAGFIHYGYWMFPRPQLNRHAH